MSPSLLLLIAVAAFQGSPPCGEREPGPDSFAEQPVLLSPAAGEEQAPTNPRLLLGGLVDRLDLEAPTWRIRLVGPAGDEISLEREGARAWPTEELQPDTEYLFIVEPTPDHGCPNCVSPWMTTFRTGTGALTSPPPAPDVTRVGLFAGDEACGGRPTVRVEMTLPPLTAGVDVAVQRPGDPAVLASRQLLLTSTAPQPHEMLTSGVDAGRGEELVVAVTVFDLAGNVSAATLHRAPVVEPIDEGRDLACDLALAPRVRNNPVPEGADLLVDFSFAPQALALQRPDGSLIPLDVVDEDVNTVRLRPAEPITDGDVLGLVALPCERCACQGCDAFEPVEVSVAAARTDRPAPPRLEGILRDLSPPQQEGGRACVDDAPGLLVHVPADDTVIAYRGVLRAAGQPGLLLERWADVVDDGDVREIHFNATSALPEASQTFELQVTAIDPAFLEQTSTIVAPAGPQPSCTAAHPVGRSAPAGLALLLGVALAFARRRR